MPVHTEVPDVELHLEKVDVPEMQTCEKNGVEMVCLTKDGLDTLNRNMLKHIALVRQCRAIREYYSASK